MSLISEIKKRANGDEEEELPRGKVSLEKREKLIKFLKANRPPIKDEEFHRKADELELNPHSAEESMYGLVAKEAQQHLPAAMIRPTVRSNITNLVADLVEKKQIRPDQAEQMVDVMMQQAMPEIRKQEELAYRRESGEQALAPATMTGAAGTVATLSAFPWALSRASYLVGRKPKDPMSLRQAFKMNFMPAWLPITGAFEVGGHLLSPMSDPQYRAGERGYWKSVGQSMKGARRHMAESGAEARERYGLFGIPLQMFHGITNPITSLSYLGEQVGGLFSKPDVKGWAQEAAERRRLLQGQS